jgi:hypothetical protein
VARQGLGGGVHHSIHAQQQRPLQGWRCKPGQQIENGNSWEFTLMYVDVCWEQTLMEMLGDQCDSYGPNSHQSSKKLEETAA